MAEEGGLAVLPGDTTAIVGHPDEGHAALLDLYGNGGGPGIDGVFHQFLHHGGRTLHHLTGGDQVSYVGIEYLNMSHGATSFLSVSGICGCRNSAMLSYRKDMAKV